MNRQVVILMTLYTWKGQGSWTYFSTRFH